MINLFSLEILIGLTVGIFIGWVLKKSLMKNEKSIDEVDLANTVKNLEQTIKDYQKENSEERGSIKKIIEDSRTGIADVIKAADNIKNTLISGGSQKQGTWGELVLEHILKENLGFTEGEEYDVRESYTDEDGRKIPDIIINFPDGRHAIVDSKVSLKAWEEYITAEDENSKKEAFDRHKISLKKHIDTLTQKNYQGIKGLNTIDTVIMFCPNETAITSLPRKGGAALFDYAMKNKVTLACPSILYYLLKTAEYSWKADKQSKNIADIIKLANLVSDQAVDIYGTAKKAQAAIADTSDKVADVMGKIKDGGNRSFLSRISRMNKLGLSPKKQIPIEVSVDDSEEKDIKVIESFKKKENK
tara:strand:- start:260 stop:1336 length:1077 start_codon:yes stop_codon:yes gene_type:complete